MPGSANAKAVEAGDDIQYPLLGSTRLLLVMLVGVGMGFLMVTRLNVSIAIVCMVSGDDGGRAAPPQDGAVSQSDADWWQEKDRHPPNRPVAQGEFQWDKTYQGLLLSSYFYGYMVGLVPSGWIADRLSVAMVLLLGVGSQGLFTMAIPVAARTDSHLLLVLRALQGLACSGVLPAATVFVRNWSGPLEYATVFAACWTFQYLLSGLTFPISSALCTTGGWPLVFYVTGALPLLWAFVAWFLLASSPAESSICSEDEKRFLESAQRSRETTSYSLTDTNTKKKSTPYISIVTNGQVWIVMGTFGTFSWFYFALNITLPTFLKETMGVNLTENGFLSGLPLLSMAPGVVVGGRLYHLLLTRWQLGRTNARKTVAAISMMLPAGLLGAILLIPPGRPYLTIALLVLSNVTAVMCVSGGPLSAGADIAPQFSGTIWALSSIIGTLTGVLAPTVAAAMTPKGSLAEWQHFFLLAVAMNVVMLFFVLLFWKSEVQPFAKSQEKNGQKSSDKMCKV